MMAARPATALRMAHRAILAGYAGRIIRLLWFVRLAG